MNDQRSLLQAASKNETLVELRDIITGTFGVSADDLADLNQANLQGVSIEKRLAQRSLPVDAFSYLIRIYNLLANGQSALPSEWDQVYSILIQVSKRRLFAQWRDDEQKITPVALTLNPDFFKIPAPAPLTFPPVKPPPLPVWRAALMDRRDWQDALQSRIDQEQWVKDALQQAIGATEEATLPNLREALVWASSGKGWTIGDRADWVGDTLLIDAKTDGCALTTRVAQAIETVQALLFSLREELPPFMQTHTTLSPDADQFDEEW